MSTEFHWDPTSLSNQQITPQCSIRLKRDLMAIYSDPPPGIFVVPDESDMTLVHALITGAFDTPYEGGMFYFIIRFPPDYPIEPPRVKLMTTDAGNVRFNPNLYGCGKVCLSILGTWDGPAWSPAHTLSSVLISIQSLMNEKPYHNEPGYEKERIPGDSMRYNNIIRHETLRVAVIGMVENDTNLNIPASLQVVIEKTFLQFYESYVNFASSKLHVHGQCFSDPFGPDGNSGCFQYINLLNRLRNVKARLSHKWPMSSAASTPTSDAESSKPI